jgi:hypothetical protein
MLQFFFVQALLKIFSVSQDIGSRFLHPLCSYGYCFQNDCSQGSNILTIICPKKQISSW